MGFDTNAMAEHLEKLLTAELAATKVVIVNESHHHAGHAGAKKGGHYFAEIHSPKFEGLSPIQRQRLVNAIIAPLVDNGVHAFSMKCIWP